MSYITTNKALAFDQIRAAVLPDRAAPAPVEVVRAVRQMAKRLAKLEGILRRKEERKRSKFAATPGRAIGDRVVAKLAR